MSQFQILGRRPFPLKAAPIHFAYTNASDTIAGIPAGGNQAEAESRR